MCIDLVLVNMRMSKLKELHEHVLFQLPEKSGQHVCQRPCTGGAIERLEIMNICVSAAQVATTCGEVTLGHNIHLPLFQI